MITKETRIADTIEFIERYLFDDVSLDDLCSQACLSRRHLYREFKMLTGDSMMNYLKKRRLTEASKELINSSQSIIDLAIKYQFESAEGFSRAFSQTFWRSPREFRNVGSPYAAMQKHRFLPEFFDMTQDISRSSGQEPQIVITKPRIMAGVRVVQPHYGFRVEHNVSECVDMGHVLKNSLHEIPHVVDGSEWNIAFRQNAQLKQHEIENVFAVEVKKICPRFDQFEYFYLPSSMYAVFPHRSRSAWVEFTITSAFHWLTASQYFLGDAPSLFHVSQGHAFSGDLFVPISINFQPDLQWWMGYKASYLRKIGNCR